MITILSGGQTGVDRAALDAALAAGIRAGGWCPEGRKAEDGRISDNYPLQELPGADYLQRTERNVADSDATLIIHFGQVQGGTARTLEFCKTWCKPHLLIDGTRLSEAEAVGQIAEFIDREEVLRLNVAGPRASGEPQAYRYTLQTLTLMLSGYPNEGSSQA
ncbi:MAG: putative molybdenum carrier protein [Gammaproteobacteria bacterium]|nr:putative molybdenum carrier protein [Gammaproteobacteria bacterium]